MGLRRKRSRIQMLIDDFNNMIKEDGSTVTFEWKEVTGGTYNSTYDIWDGGTETTQQLQEKGIGEIVKHESDVMEYEFGRISVGECFIRFRSDFDLTQFKDKKELRFYFFGQKWKVDSPLGVGEIYADQYWNRHIKGVKVND